MSMFDEFTFALRNMLPARKTLKRILAQSGVSLEGASAWLSREERQKLLIPDTPGLTRSSLNLNTTLSSLDKQVQETLARAKSQLDVIMKNPLLKSCAQAADAKQLTALQEGLQRVWHNGLPAVESGLLKSEVQSLSLAADSLSGAIHNQLCQVEKQAALSIVSSSLSNLGYSLSCRGDVIKADLGRTTVFAKADDKGGLVLDTAGFTGKACLKEVERIQDEFRRQGLVFQRTHHEHHGKAEGGVLAHKVKGLFTPFEFFRGSTGKNKTKSATREKQLT